MKCLKIINYSLVVILFVSSLIVSQMKESGFDNRNGKGDVIFKKMREVYSQSNSLSYSSHLVNEDKGKITKDSKYNVRLAKHGLSLIEAQTSDGKYKTTLIQRGDTLYLNWPTGFHWEEGRDSAETKRIRENSYMKFISDFDKHSIGHRIQNGVVGINYLFQLNPSYFHGYANELLVNYDSVNYKGEEAINGEKCYIIVVNLLDNQRKLFYWISQKDYFPRKMVQELYLSQKSTITELLTDIKINHKVEKSLFSWVPPSDWIEQKEPTLENNILESGSVAKDFEFSDMKGDLISLKNFKGKVIWLNNWKIGCPPCREEAPFLEKIYRENKKKGLVIIGIDFIDNAELVQNFIDEFKLTYPNVVDTNHIKSSDFYMNYTNSNGIYAVPLNYIIDKNGIIVKGWYGYDPKDNEKYYAIINALLNDI